MDGSAPNPFQPVIDVAVSGISKIAVTLVLGGMVYVAVAFAFRLALRGRPRALQEFCDILARAASGFSMVYLMYLGLVVIEPVRPGVPSVVFGPFMMLALMIGAVLGCVILLLVFLGAGKTPPRVEERPKRRRRPA